MVPTSLHLRIPDSAHNQAAMNIKLSVWCGKIKWLRFSRAIVSVRLLRMPCWLVASFQFAGVHTEPKELST